MWLTHGLCTALRVLERQRELVNGRHLSALRNRHRGERCFVIGNGPSLTVATLERLAGEVTFATNKIYLLFDQTRWRPSYYVVEDPHMMRQHHGEISAVHSRYTFVSDVWKHLCHHSPRVIWYPWKFLPDSEYPRFSAEAHKAVYCGFMVTYVCLQLAAFMGFSQIYLVGVDCDYPPGQTTHFTPRYFTPDETRAAPQIDRALRAMRCARQHCEADGRRIMNATRGGRLDVFERIDLDSVLRGNRQLHCGTI